MSGPALAQEEEEEGEEQVVGERPTLQVGELSPDFKFDGAIDVPASPVASRTDGLMTVSHSITNLITIEPEEGGEPDAQTIINVLANQKYIVVTARCYDHDPSGIVSFSKARDVAFEEGYQEDHLVFVLDTFLDGRSGYVFSVNPHGARSDGIVIEQGEDVNGDWDTVWEAKTSRDETGWYAEVRIPIKSLAFKKGLDSWGFNIQRRVQRLQETSRWSGASLDYEIYQTSRAGLLTDLPAFDLGVGMSIRASAVGSGRNPGPEADNEIRRRLQSRSHPKIGTEFLPLR